jgi:hypothetical protein
VPGPVPVVAAAAAEVLSSEEFRVLQCKFSSGVRFTELKSIAVVLAWLANVEPPDRDTRRQFVMLIRWFRRHWAVVSAFLPSVELRDENNVPITRERELRERGLMRWIAGQ